MYSPVVIIEKYEQDTDANHYLLTSSYNDFPLC